MAKACSQIGLPVADDCNNPDGPAQGFFTLDQAIDNRGQRLAVDSAYLGADVVRKRQAHLTICTGVVATTVQIDQATSRASGVYIVPSQPPRNGGQDAPAALVSARREVIVCGGAFRSPQLLLLSGIGPRGQLEDQGIACVQDLPHVGANLTDHVAMPIMIDLPVKDTYHRIMGILFTLYSLFLYLVCGQGLFSCTTAASVFTRLATIDDKTMTLKADGGAGTDVLDAYQPGNIPDLELILLPLNVIEMDLAARSRLTLFTTLVQTRLSGTVTLASPTDPRAHPRITYPLLADPRDRALLHKAARFAMRLADEFATNTAYPGTTALTVAPGMDREALVAVTAAANSLARQDFDGGKSRDNKADTVAKPAKPANKDLPSLEGKWATVTDDEIDAYAERTLLSSLHFGCSCRMSTDASTGVVDARLRVHGISNLRVADASVFPQIPSAHTMAPTMMVAERCADFLKEDWHREAEKTDEEKKQE